MSKVPVVSVIIPVYNAGKFLHRCLDCVLNQTFTDFEVICVNDGSVDDSKDILKSYSKLDKRIKFLDKSNTGVSESRNVGLQKAKGKYILFMDADDCIHPQLLEITCFLAEKYNADVVNFKYIKKRYESIRDYLKKRFDKQRVSVKETDYLLNFSTEKNHGLSIWKIRRSYIWSHLFKKSFVQNIKFPKNINVGEDFVWWSNVLYKKPLAVITKIPLYFYIPNAQSVLGSLKRLVYIKNMTKALIKNWSLFEKADAKDKKLYLQEFIWPVIVSVVRNYDSLSDVKDKGIAKKDLLKIYKTGMVQNVVDSHSTKYREKIKKILYS